MTSNNITLYSSPISDCCARMRIALNLKKLPYKLININLRTQQNNHDADFARINPSKTVPTLVHNNVTISQSIAALEYLDEIQPSINPFLSSDPIARAQTRTLVNIIATDTHPLLTHRVGRPIEAQFPDSDVKTWRLRWLERGLENFEAELVKLAGTCCVGDAVTLADVVLIPALWTAVRWEIDLSQYPTIARVYSNVNEMEGFKAAKQDPGPELDD